jgi:hypothetical protein
MGASNHPGLRYAKGEGRVESAEKQTKDDKVEEQQVYHQVDVRDERRCRCCSRRGSPRATSLLQKLHHDHILERSLGGATTTANVCLLCARCHEFKTSHVIEPEGNPDTGTLTFTMPRAVAHEIFKGRRIPAHVRIQEAA